MKIVPLLFLCSALNTFAAAWVLEYAPAPVDNPLKGLVPYAQPTPERFPYSMEFAYVELAELVKEPQQYDFTALEKQLNDIASRGRQTVFRVYLEYPGKKNLIPQFLIDAGLTVHKYKNTNTAPFPPEKVETPDYHHPLLRKTLQQFIAELGKRYDGDPRIGYITAGLLGTWGEWHTYPRTDLWASKAVQIEVMDAYAAAFKKTPILLRYPAGKNNDLYAANHHRPFGYHDDSFAWASLDTGKKEDDWYFQPSLIAAGQQQAWKNFPIGGEIRPEVWGCCFDQPPCTPAGQEFDRCRDALHVTWLMDTGLSREAPSPQRKQRAMQAVRKMGYEFHVARVSRVDDNVTLHIRNTGIAPFYHSNWHPEFALKSVDGTLVKRWTAAWEVRGVLPEKEPTAYTTKLTGLSNVPEAKLLVRIPNPMPGGRPLRFANADNVDGPEGWLDLRLPAAK